MFDFGQKYVYKLPRTLKCLTLTVVYISPSVVGLSDESKKDKSSMFFFPNPPDSETLSRLTLVDECEPWFVEGLDKEKVCECGADKTGLLSHSPWCPKYTVLPKKKEY